MEPSNFSSVKTKTDTLPERVADQISQLIIDRQLVSGQRLPNEFELATYLQVGRGTVREAVKLLVARNVLEIQRGKGTFITERVGEIEDPLGFAFFPDQRQLALDLQEIRLQVEPWVASMAARRRTQTDLDRMNRNRLLVEKLISTEQDYLAQDVEFHVSISECMHNLAIPKLIPVIASAVSLFGTLTSRRLKECTVLEHLAIVEAISNQDAEQAEAAMREHIEHNLRELSTLQPDILT